MLKVKGYQVVYSTTAKKDLSKIAQVYVHKILQKFQALVDGAPNIDIKKLHSRMERYRLRVGIYRAIFEVQDRTVTILVITVGHRKDIYKKFE